MYGITFNVDFEAEILEIDFGQFAFFHRGENKMSETMALAQQIQLLKTLESKFSLLGWCRNDKLWDRIDNNNHYIYRSLKLKKTVFLWDKLNVLDFGSKVKYFMNGLKGLCIEKNDNRIKYVIETTN